MRPSRTLIACWRLSTRWGSAVAILLIGVCCAKGIPRSEIAQSVIAPQPIPLSNFSLSISENYAEKVFEVTLVSQADRAICLHKHNWPNPRKQLHFSGEDVFVETSNKRYYIKNRNFGYCSGRCWMRIDPGEKLKGAISFLEFDPEMWADPAADRKLSFKVSLLFCESLDPDAVDEASEDKAVQRAKRYKSRNYPGFGLLKLRFPKPFHPTGAVLPL